MEGSKKYSLNKEDAKSIGKGALIAIAGALLTYFTGVIPNVDWGVYAPIVTAAFGILANSVRKFLKDYTA